MRNRIGAVDDHAPRRQIRPVEQLHQPGMLDMRIVDQLQRGVHDLRHVVAGDRCRHAHRDAGRAVGKQIGEQAGEQLRLFLLAIVCRDEIDRAFVQPGHQLDRGLRQPGFGVAIGGGVIPVDIAEIALPLHQRIAQREILREAHHRVIDRGVAMRVILADHIAHHTRGFLERIGRIELQLPHRPQQPAMDRLQPVTQVRQRAGGDGRKGIDEVTLAERGIERGIDNRVERIGGFVFGGGGHVGCPNTPGPAALAPCRVQST